MVCKPFKNVYRGDALLPDPLPVRTRAAVLSLRDIHRLVSLQLKLRQR